MANRRYAVELSEKLEKLLDELAEEKHTTKAEIIRRAIASYSYLDAEAQSGSTITIKNEGAKSERQIVFMQ